jgi:hypothetical protein
MHSLLGSYLGRRQFPKDMSRFEIRHFFQLTDGERRELRVRFPKKVRLGAALQLGFLRMTSATLAALDYVPRALLKYLGKQLQCPAPYLATLRALYQVTRTHPSSRAFKAWYCTDFYGAFSCLTIC